MVLNSTTSIDIVTTIEKLDETGFIHGPRVLGMEIMRLEYTFTPVMDGTISRAPG